MSSNTTSAPSTSGTTAMSRVQSTETSIDSCLRVAGQDTSTRTGVVKTKPTQQPPIKPPKSPSALKAASEPGSSSTSNSKNGLDSTLSDEEEKEDAKREIELDTYLAVQSEAKKEATQKKRKLKKVLPVATKTHMLLRKSMEEGEKWELALHSEHGLAREEIRMVVGIMAQHLKDDTFPEYDPEATRGIDFYRTLAKPGWYWNRMSHQQFAEYPTETCQQVYDGNGNWRMCDEFGQS